MEKTTPDPLQLMGSITPLSAGFQQRALEQLFTEHFAQGELLISPGETARRVYFIQSGLFRAYTIDQQGREHTNWFMSTGDVMISVYSFFTQKPAQEYIQVLQTATVQSLTWNQLNSYYADFPEGNLIGRILTQQYYMQSEERSINLRMKTPLERYRALTEKHPDLEQQTTQTNIASYLEISRETLSRLRSSMLKKAIHRITP